MSGDDVRSSNKPDARKYLPAGAGTARVAAGWDEDGHGQGGGIHAEITWVGQQQRMHGYCGRADAAPAARPAVENRPVALLQRPRGVVVRIGPRALAETADVQAKAA